MQQEQDRRCREEVAAAEAADKELKELATLCDLLVEVGLLKIGYHKHKGEWRKRRAKACEDRDGASS